MNRCNLCNYETILQYNFDKHLNTLKHKNNVKKAITHKCEYCDENFNDENLLKLHIEKCIVISFNFYKNKKEEYEIKIKDYVKEIQKYDLSLKEHENKLIEYEILNKENEKKNQLYDLSIKDANIKNKENENKLREYEILNKENDKIIKKYELTLKEYENKCLEYANKNKDLEINNKILEVKNEELKKTLKSIKISSTKKIENQENKIEKLRDKTENYLEGLVNTSGNIIDTSVNMAKSSLNVLSYVMKNYNDAPVITKLEKNNMYDKKDKKYVDDIEYYYNHKILDEHIGNYIVVNYKKDDKSQQSLWNTDGTRFNYIIKTIINDNPDWIIDKNAIQVCKFLIDPLLNIIKNDLESFIIAFNKENKKNIDKMDRHTAIINIKKVQILNDVISNIDDGTLRNNILKYITPHFHINKTLAIKN